MKSATCIGVKSGKPLTEYDSKQEALEGANHANSRYRQKLVPYHCGDCGCWHLSPKDRQTPSEKCVHCTGRNGEQKDSYRSREDASRRARILRQEQGVTLSVYACEYGSGWHLTGTSRR
jgi:hypothetical protein